MDEADFYKNLFLYTKMRNVAGLAQTEAQKSSDLFAKCRYLDELTGGRGIVFATGDAGEQQYYRDVYHATVSAIRDSETERAAAF